MLSTLKLTSKLSRRQAVQEQAITDFSAAAAHYLDTIVGDVEIANLLSGRGYGTARLAEGCRLQQRLQTAIAHRQTLIDVAGDARCLVASDQATVKPIVVKATANRNAAYDDLKAYMKNLKSSAILALRPRPDLLKKLDDGSTGW